MCRTRSASQQLKRGKGKEDLGVNVRFTNLPVRVQARDIRSDHINRFVSVEGILRKTTEVRPRIVKAVFRCPGGHLTTKAQEFGMFVEPDGCATEGCTYRKLTLVPKRSSFVDAQKLRIQESPEGLRGGEQPQTIDVDVTDDITGTVAPGRPGGDQRDPPVAAAGQPRQQVHVLRHPPRGELDRGRREGVRGGLDQRQGRGGDPAALERPRGLPEDHALDRARRSTATRR